MHTRKKAAAATLAALVAILAALLVALPGVARADALQLAPAGLAVPNYPADGDCYDAYVDCGSMQVETDTLVEPANAYAYSSGQCLTRWARATRHNLFWFVVFRYNEQVRWCWNNGSITYFWRDRWPSDTHFGWGFDGNIGSNCALEHCNGRGVGTYSTDVWTQGAFHACVGIKLCVYRYPMIDIWVHGDGGSGASVSGA